MFAFQHRQASERCCRMVRALFCLIPSGIMSTISCITYKTEMNWYKIKTKKSLQTVT